LLVFSEDCSDGLPSDEPPIVYDKYTRERSEIIHMLKLRARFNGQRSYEIYSISTSLDLTEDDLWLYFENNPQTIVDLIRKKELIYLGPGVIIVGKL
jgi:hypothetical protein